MLDLSKIDFDRIKWVFFPQIHLDTEANQDRDIFESKDLLLYALNSIQDTGSACWTANYGSDL